MRRKVKTTRVKGNAPAQIMDEVVYRERFALALPPRLSQQHWDIHYSQDASKHDAEGWVRPPLFLRPIQAGY